MDDTSVLIVVSVLQGRNFDLLTARRQLHHEPAAHSLPEITFQARFLGEELLSDPIALTSSSDDSEPAVCKELMITTELCWEVTRKDLHQFRVERKPIKLQAFVTDVVSREKTLIGYWIFDIRSAQESADPKFEWKPLLNPKFRGNSKQRPEVLCALQLIRSDGGEAVADESSLAESPKSLTSISDPSLLENDIQVRQENGIFRIWDSRLTSEKDCGLFYCFSIEFSSIIGLQKLLPDNIINNNNNNGDFRPLHLHFQISLFGKDFISNGFSCQTTRRRIEMDEEVIHVFLAVDSAHTIRAYFQLYPVIDVCLLHSDQILASATIPLAKVFADHIFQSMTGEFRLLRADDSDTSEPHPSVGIRVSITPDPQMGKCQENTEMRHFRFSMDIRCLKPISLSPGSFFIRYLYATFGSLDKVVTSVVEVDSDLNALTFSDGYCAFNFVTTTAKLYETFSELPLLLELMEKKNSGDGSSSLTAICKLDLRKVYECEEDMEGKKLLVMKPHMLNPVGESVAQVTVISCLRDMGAAAGDASSLAYFNASADGKNADVFEQLYVTAAVELEVWKQQQKHKFQKKLLQSMKSHGKINSLEQELRDCLERVKKREQELDDSKAQMDRLEEEYSLRTQKLSDEISQAVLQVQVMYESRIEKERQTIRNLEEQNKQLTAELASLKPKTRPSSRTQSLARVGSISSNPVRSVSRSRAASVTSDLSKPLVRDPGSNMMGSKTSLTGVTRRPPQKAGASSNKFPADRKSSVLNDLKNERDSLLRNGLCRSDDPIIKTIETELRRNGVRTK